jgi:hypothetical protein
LSQKLPFGIADRPEQLDEARARVPRAQHQLRPVLQEGGAALVSLSHLK